MSALTFDQSVRLILSDDVLQSVFHEIATNRSMLFKEISASLSKNDTVVATLGADALSADARQNEIAREVERAVETLKDAALIKERPAPIGDFSTYYVTAEGLTAERKLKMVNSAIGA